MAAKLDYLRKKTGTKCQAARKLVVIVLQGQIREGRSFIEHQPSYKRKKVSGRWEKLLIGVVSQSKSRQFSKGWEKKRSRDIYPSQNNRGGSLKETRGGKKKGNTREKYARRELWGSIRKGGPASKRQWAGQDGGSWLGIRSFLHKIGPIRSYKGKNPG